MTNPTGYSNQYRPHPTGSFGPTLVTIQPMTKAPFGMGFTSPRHGAAPKITWASRDNHATTCQPCRLVGRPPSRPPWDLRVPTLFLFNLFLYYYMLMLLSLLRSDRMGACSHSRLGDRLYAFLR